VISMLVFHRRFLRTGHTDAAAVPATVQGSDHSDEE